MYCRGLPVLVLIFACLTAGCTKDVSTNYHDSASYHAGELTKDQNVNLSESTTDVSKDILQYAGQIKKAIEEQFRDPSKYSGKSCSLRMYMAPNGLLLQVKREGGDPELCREAMNAVKHADIPAPPSPEVYKVFHNGVLDFKP
ncbi:cell envelope integrity protein TolA [Escherichia coli]|nr:cell envelope integrity protein TolA [Escherichia coli]EFN6912029.1 cell envelope integrity protein TolA [Escherichia coli O10]ELO3213245.1 cell envelope integrity protein TolA [Escherichia coli]ELO4358595.1 cell envelope integrity protein TolA [Escherichia coli]MED8099710.1 cell envelope integrity protein TolA [Escherichia coli]